MARKLSLLCDIVKWYASCFRTPSFSSFQTTEDYMHLPPSPNGQGHTVHSSSQNWVTQGHSWNMGGTCGRDLSYTKDAFKKACDRGQPCDRCQALPAEPSWLPSKVRESPVACCDCGYAMRMRNVNWESTGGTGMCKLSAYHTGKLLLRYLPNVIPGRNNAGINLFPDNCVWFILFIIVHSKPRARREMFTFHRNVSACHLKVASIRECN